MNQVKLVIQFHQRFRSAEKEIAAIVEVGKKVVDHFRLRDAVEIDQNVAAQNQVHALHEKHFRIVLQVQAAERDQLFYLRENLQFFLVDDREIFPFVVVGGISERVVAINARLSGFDGMVVQVGRQNFHRPAL